MSRDIEDLEKVYYCTRCLSLDIRDDDHCVMRCHSCGADVYQIDICDYSRWEQLFTETYGKPLLDQKTVYDDLEESFKEDAPEVMTSDEALSNGLNVGEWLNRKIKD